MPHWLSWLERSSHILNEKDSGKSAVRSRDEALFFCSVIYVQKLVIPYLRTPTCHPALSTRCLWPQWSHGYALTPPSSSFFAYSSTMTLQRGGVTNPGRVGGGEEGGCLELPCSEPSLAVGTDVRVVTCLGETFTGTVFTVDPVTGSVVLKKPHPYTVTTCRYNIEGNCVGG